MRVILTRPGIALLSKRQTDLVRDIDGFVEFPRGRFRSKTRRSGRRRGMASGMVSGTVDFGQDIWLPVAAVAAFVAAQDRGRIECLVEF